MEVPESISLKHYKILVTLSTVEATVQTNYIVSVFSPH